MKKLAGITLSALLLVGCGSPSEEVVEQGERFESIGLSSTKVITDTETGCKYLFTTTGYAGGMSPLYAADGEVDCGKTEEESS